MNTATPEVLEMGQIHLEGNIIPHTWYEHIKFENGKVDLNSIVILADIVYWYRPTYVRDEISGKILEIRKKFAGDLLQRHKKKIADQFGLSDRQVQDSLARLEAQGLITRVYRTVEYEGGGVVGNVLFIRIHPEKIKQLMIQKCYPYGNETPEGKESITTGSAIERQTYTKNTTQISPEKKKKNAALVSPEKKKKKSAALASIHFDYDSKAFVNIELSDLSDWKSLYPDVNIDHELKKMRQWLIDPDNPERDGNRTFITNWLSRAQKDATKTPKKFTPQEKKAPKRDYFPYDHSIAYGVLNQDGLDAYVRYLKECGDQSYYNDHLQGKYTKAYIRCMEHLEEEKKQ